MSEHKSTPHRLRRMIMDGLNISTIQNDDTKAELAKEYLANRRFYAKTAIIITSLVCITLTLAFIIFGNQVGEATIRACESACQSSGSIMQEATAYRCTCISAPSE